MEKNRTVRLTIEDLTEEGEGIGRIDGYTLFVRDAVIGDVVEAKVVKTKKNYGYGRLLRVRTPSPDRVRPRCPVAGPCGGCQLQSMSYEAQLRFKRRKVESCLERIGGLDGRVSPVIGMENPWEYRNKAQVPVGRDRDGRVICGFYAGRSHRIVETEHCFLGSEENEVILRLVKDHMRKYHIEPYDEETGTGLMRHVLIRRGRATGEWMVCLVINGTGMPGAEELVRTLRSRIPGLKSISLNRNSKRGNRILGEEIENLYGPGSIVDRIGGLSFHISPLSFYQVNPVQTGKLYEKVCEFAGLTGGETVWDLYCGIGTLSLFLAEKARRVFGVEAVSAAVEDARANAQENGVKNVEFFAGRAEEVLPQYCARQERETGKMPHADVIVVDPPRRGCEGAVLSAMLAMQPSQIVYVSCDAATLARDLKILCRGGYRMERVQPVDMFPQTVAVETVCLLSGEGEGNPAEAENKGRIVGGLQ